MASLPLDLTKQHANRPYHMRHYPSNSLKQDVTCAYLAHENVSKACHDRGTDKWTSQNVTLSSSISRCLLVLNLAIKQPMSRQMADRNKKVSRL